MAHIPEDRRQLRTPDQYIHSAPPSSSLSRLPWPRWIVPGLDFARIYWEEFPTSTLDSAVTSPLGRRRQLSPLQDDHLLLSLQVVVPG